MKQNSKKSLAKILSVVVDLAWEQKYRLFVQGHCFPDGSGSSRGRAWA